MSKGKVLVAMSGGVDSSVTALLLKKEGYTVVGITFKMLGETTHPYVINQLEDAKKVSKILDIEHEVINIEDEFKTLIIDYFSKEYLSGKTPNPCVFCNKIIKFNNLLKIADRYNADFIATGHYATVEKNEKEGYYILKMAKNKFKDQSYFLYRIDQKILSRIIFPLSSFDKNKIREIAKNNHLHVHDKGDSHEICFIKGDDYRSFFREQNIPLSKSMGNIEYKNGMILGYHKGIYNYTIGQRRGLGISHPTPLYVMKIDSKNNRIIVGEKKDLLHTELYATNLNWIHKPPEPGKKIFAKIRSIHIPAEATIVDLNKDLLKIVFNKPQWAITPGQSVVLYEDDVVLGGGVITHGR